MSGAGKNNRVQAKGTGICSQRQERDNISLPL